MRDIRFLLVDGSKIIKNAIAKILNNRLGTEATHIFSARNGNEALEMLEKEPIDIIICEWEISYLDGQETLKKIRAHSRFKDMPFIMMSTQGGKEAVVTSIQNGVSQYLVKPFTPEKLEDTVRKAWNGAQKRAAQRYSGLPKHHLNAIFDGQSHDAQVINISRSGGLISLVYQDSVKLFDLCELSLEFDDIDDVGLVTVSPLQARVLRIEASHSFHHSTRKCEVGLSFVSEGMCKDAQRNLDKLIEFLADKENAIFKTI